MSAPRQPGAFEPNRILKVTPDFLDQVVRFVVERGFEVLSLDEVEYRLAEGDFDRPFACFTFDDGYRDNRQYAYPIFRRYGLPFAIYVPTRLPGRPRRLVVAEAREGDRAPRAPSRSRCTAPGRSFECRTPARRSRPSTRSTGGCAAFRRPRRAPSSAICASCTASTSPTLCSDLVMNWDEIRDLASDPLVTIGAHTRRHFALAKLSLGEARLEIEESVRRIEPELGRPCRHFSFPYGDEASAGPREFDLVRELGLKTAVTTRKGLIHARHADPADGAAAAVAQRRVPEAALRQGDADGRAVRHLGHGAEADTAPSGLADGALLNWSLGRSGAVHPGDDVGRRRHPGEARQGIIDELRPAPRGRQYGRCQQHGGKHVNDDERQQQQRSSEAATCRDHARNIGQPRQPAQACGTPSRPVAAGL